MTDSLKNLKLNQTRYLYECLDIFVKNLQSMNSEKMNEDSVFENRQEG